MAKYETIIGLEVHAQLKTQSKMFCSCSNHFGDSPNTNICPICTGQPGTLPVINKKAIELAIKTALALNCKINKKSVFARKNYFYPDLPKDYQISQFELPLAEHGCLAITINGEEKKIGITRIHLEEDAGKLVHKGAARIMGSDYSLADYNRTGTPLMEIVSDPDIRSPQEAKIYIEMLAHLLEYIGVCDAKMEEGSLRCDANISLRLFGAPKYGIKTEIKNMNSFKSVMKALCSEEKRHKEVLDENGQIIQETRFYDDVTETTSGMRSKESSHDYRYFPEPDLVPLEPTQEWIDEIKRTLGELPEDKKLRYMKDYSLKDMDAEIMLSSTKISYFFEETIKHFNNPKIIANWIMVEILAYLKENKIEIDQASITPSQFAELLTLIENGTVSGTLAKTILAKALSSGETIQTIIKEQGLTQISNENELISIVQEVIKACPKQVEQFKTGKEAVIMFLVGQVMKTSRGRAKPDVVQKILREEIAKIS